MEFIIPALIFLVLIVIVSNIRVVPQSYAIVIERLGAYYTTCTPDFISRYLFLTVCCARFP